MQSEKQKKKLEKSMPSGVILEWDSYSNDPMPIDRIELISEMPKIEAILLLAYINNRICPRVSRVFDYSLKTQESLLEYVLRIEQTPGFRAYIQSKLFGRNILFNRPANLIAFTEVMNSNLPDARPNGAITAIDLENFLRYYLCVNSYTSTHSTSSTKPEDNAFSKDFEEINASILAYNEHMIDVNPVYTLYRGMKLIDALMHSSYGQDLQSYAKRVASQTPLKMLARIAELYMSSHDENRDDEYRMVFPFKEKEPLILELSRREYPIKERYELEALNIKKAPFYDSGENFMVLLDGVMLLEKCCDYLAWDFLFNEILSRAEKSEKEREIINYRSFFGRFFERYVRETIEYSFEFLRVTPPKLFDDLKIGGDECGDIFIRQNKKILFGEVKSSGIRSDSKYGTDASNLYNQDKGKFFKTHGLDQLLSNMKRLHSDPNLFDKKMVNNKRYKVYPIILTNEKSLIAGLMPSVFGAEFEKENRPIQIYAFGYSQTYGDSHFGA